MPQLRERALAGTLNEVTCPSCGQSVPANAAFIYTDVERGQWIYVGKPSDLPRWRGVERDALQLFDRALSSSPLAMQLPHTHVRIVFDADELRERLVIWDAGLDDARVECLKLQCIRERPDVRGPHERIRVLSINSATIEFAAERAPGVALRGWSAPQNHLTSIERDPQWRSEFPELFARGFISYDRYLI